MASVALIGDGHEGETYTLTGPTTITFKQAAGYLSEAVGREIEYPNVPDEAARQGMIEEGTPGLVAEQIVAVFRVLRRGAQERTTGTVRGLTGREPSGFADFACEHARRFAPPLSDRTKTRKRHKRRGRTPVSERWRKSRSGVGVSRAIRKLET